MWDQKKFNAQERGTKTVLKLISGSLVAIGIVSAFISWTAIQDDVLARQAANATSVGPVPSTLIGSEFTVLYFGIGIFVLGALLFLMAIKRKSKR